MRAAKLDVTTPSTRTGSDDIGHGKHGNCLNLGPPERLEDGVFHSAGRGTVTPEHIGISISEHFSPWDHCTGAHGQLCHIFLDYSFPHFFFHFVPYFEGSGIFGVLAGSEPRFWRITPLDQGRMHGMVIVKADEPHTVA
jgi:hypothetical protein